MGDVYAGYDEKLDRKVALKVLHAENRLDAESRERLVREARALSKLDHPHICRIFDYIESSDVDVLVLEFINGRTLQDVIYDEQTSRSEKLRIAIAVAEVLVAAHRVGIVHRDLKPENVMLTKEGEVKVLDFGLARWLVQSTSKRLKAVSSGSVPALVPEVDKSDNLWFSVRPESATVALPRYDQVVPIGSESFNQTAAGVTMGTPLYMSPEQARGEELTTASDMFSFGLLLQCLFTGGEPHPVGLTAREVILRAARGETLPVQGVSGDVTALINRLKQFAPADRPTAIESVARLRFLADKTPRTIRRSAIAVAILIVVFGAWRYTTDLARERTIAVKARAEADKRRAQAEDLIEFMLGDLRDKLARVGRLDLLDDVGERALRYVASLHPETMSAGELARNAKALNQLGEVRLDQGKTPEALALFDRSLRLANFAVKREPRNPDALMAFGTTHFFIGDGLNRQGNKTESLQHMREYQKVGDTLATIDPMKKEYQLERAFGHNAVAYALEANGNLGEALDHYKTSLAIREQLSRMDPADSDAQDKLALAYNKLAVLLYKGGDLRSSLEYSRREVEIDRSLVARNPKDQPLKQQFASALAYLARTLDDLGSAEEAAALWQEELRIEQHLAMLDPANVRWQRAVAMTMRRVGASAATKTNPAHARELLDQAYTRILDVLRQAPTTRSYVGDAANIEAEYGRLLIESRNRRGLDLIRQSIARVDALPQKDHYLHVTTARAAYYLGEALANTNPAAARDAWSRAEQEMQPRSASLNPNELALWVRILVRQKRAAEAREALTRLERTGYATTQLKQLCSENGC